MSRPRVYRVTLSALEREVCEAMQRATALPTLEALVRASLWKMARHLELDLPVAVFDIRGPQKIPAHSRRPATAPAPEADLFVGTLPKNPRHASARKPRHASARAGLG